MFFKIALYDSVELTLEVETEPTVVLSRLGSFLSPPKLCVII